MMGCSNTKSVQLKEKKEQGTSEKTEEGVKNSEQTINGDIPSDETSPAAAVTDKQTDQNTDQAVAEVLSGDAE